MTMALTVTRANKKPFTVKPLVIGTMNSRGDASPKPDAPKLDASESGPSGGGNSPATISVDEALLIKAGEFASCGIEQYAAWWQGSLTAAQRKAIGAEKHAEFKRIVEAA